MLLQETFMSTSTPTPHISSPTPHISSAGEQALDARVAAADKAVLTLRYRLLGAAQENPAWLKAVQALEFSRAAHLGMTRDDKVTPYIIHPVQVALYALTLRGSLIHPVETIAACLLHDVVEDCHISYAQLTETFGKEVSHAVQSVTKPRVPQGHPMDKALHFGGMALCPIASIVKGCDRGNNQGTLGGQTPGRQLRKVEETEAYVLPMLKTARRSFPQQDLAYENIKLLLINQIELVRAVHGEKA
jgi:GTP pyrophosphokinase